MSNIGQQIISAISFFSETKKTGHLETILYHKQLILFLYSHQF